MPTGTVTVALSEKGIPNYIIQENVAWDHLAVTPAALGAVRAADAICFGSLAQRGAVSRASAAQRLGKLPWNAPSLFTSVAKIGNGISINWQGQPGAMYELLFAENLQGAWTVASMIPSDGVTTGFVDSDATRAAKPMGFYRLRLR